MDYYSATGTRNKQLENACKKLSQINDKNPRLYNSGEMRRTVNILLELYRTTRKKHNPDLIIDELRKTGFNADWAKELALMWDTVCTLKEITK